MSKIQQRLLFLSIFIILGFISLQIPVSKLAGSNVSFTFFDFFGPIAGAFLGPIYGVFSVLVIELVNFYLKNTQVTAGSVIRLFPMLFAVYYFGVLSGKKSGKIILAVPLLAILAFNANPVGRSVWYYSLFWLIPLVAYFKKDNLFVRSLGSTFTAHAVGGAAWIWTFNLPASVWKGLIPVVIQERLFFSLGICLAYLSMRYVLKFLISKKLLPHLDSLRLSF